MVRERHKDWVGVVTAESEVRHTVEENSRLRKNEHS